MVLGLAVAPKWGEPSAWVTPACVTICRKTALCIKPSLSLFQAKSVMVAEVMAPAWLHRFIIGKKGQNIGRITQQLPKVSVCDSGGHFSP